MARKALRMTEDELKDYLDHYSREPFKKMLVPALANQPDPGKIKVFANKTPDRYAQYLTQIAKLAGYSSEKIEVDHYVNLSLISDSELRSMLIDLRNKLDATENKDIEIRRLESRNCSEAELVNCGDHRQLDQVVRRPLDQLNIESDKQIHRQAQTKNSEPPSK